MITQDTPAAEQWQALHDALKMAMWRALTASKETGAAVEQLRQEVLSALIETAPTPELIAEMARALTIIRYGELWSPERTRVWMQQAMRESRHVTTRDLALTIATALGQPSHADTFVPLACYWWQACGYSQANPTAGKPGWLDAALQKNGLPVDWAVGYESTELP